MFHKARLVCVVLASVLWLAGPDLADPLERFGGGRISNRGLQGGATSTQRSTANVKQFGAVGDGSQDDTAAVRAAIDSLSDAGGVVLFPVGRYRASVAFACRAESLSMLVALASMISKYVRELFMKRLNRWFAARLPGLRPTAGYPVDGARFLDDTAEFRARAGIADEDLVRSR